MFQLSDHYRVDANQYLVHQEYIKHHLMLNQFVLQDEYVALHHQKVYVQYGLRLDTINQHH